MANRSTNLNKKLSFRLDGQRIEELEAYAERHDLPVSFVLRHLVIRFLEDQRRYGDSTAVTTHLLEGLP